MCFERVGEALVAATKDGPSIRVSSVAATGYELLNLVPANGHRISSTWAIATKPQPRHLWRDEAFVWEASEPYRYLRTTPDCQIICGGEDEDFSDEQTRDKLTPSKADAIRRKLARLIPRVDTEPEFVWTGSFGPPAPACL